MDSQLFVAALSRPSRLADDPRSPAGDGQGSPHRQRPDCLVPPEGRGEAKAERSRSKGLKPALTRHSAITHQRSNGTGNKAARSEAGAANAPAASRNGGKAGNGKPVGSQLQKGAGNDKPAQGAGQSAGKSKPAGKPAHKGKTPTRSGTANPGAKSAAQGGKPAAKGNGAKRPAR